MKINTVSYDINFDRQSSCPLRLSSTLNVIGQRQYPALLFVPPKKSAFKISFGTFHWNWPKVEFLSKLPRVAREGILDAFAQEHSGQRFPILTPFDTWNVLEERYNRALVKSELDINSLSDAEIDNIYMPFTEQMKQASKNGQFLVATGLPGSGKTTIIEEFLGLGKDFFNLDADKLKARMRGFKKYGSKYVHPASVELVKAALDKAFRNGYNTIVQTTGWHEYVIELVEKARAHNYAVQAVHVLLGKMRAMERAVIRFEKGEGNPLAHRLVDPFDIKQMNYVKNVRHLFKQLLEEHKIERLRIFDNNGTKPRSVVDKFKEG